MIIDVSRVTSVYSGKPGCCCGCNGDHLYASAFRVWSSRNRGYPVTDTEVNDAAVRRQVAMMNRMPPSMLEWEENHVAYETPSRLYIAYFDPENPARSGS